MSLMYRTLLSLPDNCLQYEVVNGSGSTDFIEVTFNDCDGLGDSVTLTVPGSSIVICSSTIPAINAIVGAGSVTATGLKCNTSSSLKVDFLTKTTDPGNILNLTTDTCNSFGFNTTVNQLTITTTSRNYTVQVYNAGVLYQTFSALSRNTVNTITNTSGTFTYFVIGEIGMTFTSQIVFSFISAPPPQSNSVTGTNATGQTIT